jgi:hypothetical protein
VGMPFKDIATSGERAACGHQGLGVWG